MTELTLLYGVIIFLVIAQIGAIGKIIIYKSIIRQFKKTLKSGYKIKTITESVLTPERRKEMEKLIYSIQVKPSRIDDFIKEAEHVKYSLKDCEEILPKLIILTNKFDDYVDVLRSRKDIENGDVCTLDEAFNQKDKENETTAE